MRFLREKFADKENYLATFLGPDNTLLELDKTGRIDEDIKRRFVEQFTAHLVKEGVVKQDLIESLNGSNPWSVDFPSWTGEFNENRGKRFMIIGAEPHIHYPHVQTVYQFNGEKSPESFLEAHPIFSFLSEVLASRFQISRTEALLDCYLTDLFPLGPLRGNGIHVGSAEKIQAAIGEAGNWRELRLGYARTSLKFEIAGVKPEVIITQGKDVLMEVIAALGIKSEITHSFVKPSTGKGQYIRKVMYDEIPVISVPHLGSRRIRTFWQKNLEQIKTAFQQI